MDGPSREVAHDPRHRRDRKRSPSRFAGQLNREVEAPVDPRDIAAVAARALLTDELVDRRLELTGPEALTHEEMVDAVGTALGRPERFVDAYLARLAYLVERPAHPTGDVAEMLGRPATTYAQWAAEHADAFLLPPTSHRS